MTPNQTIEQDYREAAEYVRETVGTLTPELRARWEDVLEANEWFDGESIFQAAALRRMLELHNERHDSNLTVVEWVRQNAGTNDFASSLLCYWQRNGTLTERQTAAVERIINRPAAPVQTNPVAEQGMYAKVDPSDFGLDIFRVKLSQAGRLYALRLNTLTGEFEYDRGAIKSLSADDRLTVEQAVAFGHTYGRCIVCGRDLTDPKSVAQGIGPVCIKRV